MNWMDYKSPVDAFLDGQGFSGLWEINNSFFTALLANTTAKNATTHPVTVVYKQIDSYGVFALPLQDFLDIARPIKPDNEGFFRVIQ